MRRRHGDEKIKKDVHIIIKMPQQALERGYYGSDFTNLPEGNRQGKFVVRRRQSSYYSGRQLYIDLHPENEYLDEQGNQRRLGYWANIPAKYTIRTEGANYKLMEELN